MTPGTQIILSGTLTFGVPLALAVRDLIALRRPSGGSWRPEPPEPIAPPPSGGGGSARASTTEPADEPGCAGTNA